MLEEASPSQSLFETAPETLEVDQEITLGNKNVWQDQDGRDCLQYAIGYQDKLPGSVQLVHQPGDNVASLGYSGRTHLPETQGRGLIARSARRLCQYAFEDLGLEAIKLNIDRDNEPSIRTAQRLGATLVDDSRTMLRWRIDREQFLAALYDGDTSRAA